MHPAHGLLAEISDKMPTITGMWVGSAIFAAIFALIALRHRWAGVGVTVLAVVWSALVIARTYHDWYLEGAFSSIVRQELGTPWVVTSFATACLPVVAALTCTIIRWRRDFGAVDRDTAPSPHHFTKRTA